MTDVCLSHAGRPLGKSGLKVSPIAWGMWRFHGNDVAAARARVDAALEAGITLFDTADIYGIDDGGFGSSEALLGKVFAEDPSLRAQIVLATKGGIEPGVPYNSSADYLVKACEASLKRLRVDHVDLYQIHRPDILAHPIEIARAFNKLWESGKIRAVGVSNYTPGQVAALHEYLTVPLATTQPEFSPLAIAPLSDGTLDQALALHLAVLAWSPLGGGRLLSPETKREREVHAAIARIANDLDASPSAVAYAWILQHPSRPIPIVGSQQQARIRDASEALKLKLSRAAWYEILTASRQERLP